MFKLIIFASYLLPSCPLIWLMKLKIHYLACAYFSSTSPYFTHITWPCTCPGFFKERDLVRADETAVGIKHQSHDALVRKRWLFNFFLPLTSRNWAFKHRKGRNMQDWSRLYDKYENIRARSGPSRVISELFAVNNLFVWLCRRHGHAHTYTSDFVFHWLPTLCALA